MHRAATQVALEGTGDNAAPAFDQLDAALDKAMQHSRNQLRGDIWSIETLQAWAGDPQGYSGLAGSAIYNLMAREFAPLPERLKSATARMEKLPAMFAQMRANAP